MVQKMPCSISILTLNSEKGLPACLESLKDFSEIIVCDGNSTDRTREIAAEYGAKVIRQYDTDEPHTSCVMDKASVRERAMNASSYDWRFFMDSDDSLSKEAGEEIRAIVTDPSPKQLVWRMPSRIFIGGREILHEATYPSYQTRLVHKKVGAKFKNHVHDRLTWNEKEFPVGTMKHAYDFHWSTERVANYWPYLREYARREVQVENMGSFFATVQWKLRRIRTIFGYLFWRLPAMYARHGFKDSMPLSIELTIVRYHCAVLVGMLAKYMTTRFWYVLISETLRGKDLNRILTNIASRDLEAYGRVFDVGGGHGASHWRYMETRRWHRTTTLDIDPQVKPDIVLNLEKEKVPFEDGHFDTVLLFNVLEHLRERVKILTELRRVLRPGGTLVGIIPFLVAVHADPHDFVRCTNEELKALFAEAGFSKSVIRPVGRGPLVASFYQSEFLWPRILKLCVLPVVLALDAVILRMRPSWRDKFPLSYLFIVE